MSLKTSYLLSLLLVFAASLPKPPEPIVDYPQVIYKCGIKTLESEGMCEVTEEFKDFTVVHVIDSCKSNQICAKNSQGTTCVDVPQKLDAGKKCMYNVDCFTDLCEKGRCKIKSKPSELCEIDRDCPNGYFCQPLDKDTKTCQPLARKPGDLCSADLKCGYGLKCVDYRCVAWGSYEIGQSSHGDPILCKTGMHYKEVCVELKEEPICNHLYERTDLELKGYRRKKGEKYPSGLCVGDYDANGIMRLNVEGFSMLRNRVFREFIEAVESTDPYTKLYDDVHNYYADRNGNVTLGSNMVKRYYLNWIRSEHLIRKGLLDYDGGIIHRCEYNHYMKNLSGGFLKNSFLLGAALLMMLL